ncbi:MAG: DUF4160 domain-containing protein [Muribaculaceae bacterium]|nr:DUF4160 domain-containing protein [Muribaculaceae bacterium]
MPTLSIFFGIIIYMYKEDGGKHNLPHIHAEYGEYEAVFDLDGNKIEGDLPKKKIRMVQTWIDIHQEDLMANWKLIANGQQVFRIPPLQ